VALRRREVMAIVTVATTVMTPLVKLASISRRTGV
jgi:hypothetical protein